MSVSLAAFHFQYLLCQFFKNRCKHLLFSTKRFTFAVVLNRLQCKGSSFELTKQILN
nr:MAG TPA: hypothetical protein [Caudoviricetes sp.]